MPIMSSYNQKVSSLLLEFTLMFLHDTPLKYLPIPHCPSGRHLSTHRMNSQTQRQSQMNLCGSRGTGGVISFGTSTTLTMYDLEEDEENSSEGDDDHDGLEDELSLEDDEE